MTVPAAPSAADHNWVASVFIRRSLGHGAWSAPVLTIAPGSRTTARRPAAVPPAVLRAGADHEHRDVVHQDAPAEFVQGLAHRRHQLLGLLAGQAGELVGPPVPELSVSR